MRRIFAAVLWLCVGAALAGCGVDGPPEPVKSPPKTKYRVSGAGSIGVVGRF